MLVSFTNGRFRWAVGVVAAVLPMTAVAQDLETLEQPVVYGQDDRRDLYEITDDSVRTLVTESVVTLVNRSNVNAADPNNVRINGQTLGQAFNLCSGERYADQPTGGFCSGTLIAPDLVLTAGHCVTDTSCRRVSFVFGYAMTSSSRVGTITTQDVFSCARVIAREENDTADYAVVQLDRSAAPRFTPASVRASRSGLPAGTPLLMIGSPSGLPVKVDDGGSVRNPQDGAYFVATTDSFGGNSGSGVWSPASLEVVGILTAGDTDYVQSGSCQRVNVCSESGCQGEKVLYVSRAVDAFCEEGTDEDLCNSSARCGDGYCAYSETSGSCAQDCTAARCGDGICGVNEWQSCDDDCRVFVPSNWECDPSYYGSLDGCDCNCGDAEDPDCQDPSQERFNCDDEALCSAVPTGPKQRTPASQWSLLALALGAAFVSRRRFARVSLIPADGQGGGPAEVAR
jgi:V8-like Glu-specific endopeptidase